MNKETDLVVGEGADQWLVEDLSQKHHWRRVTKSDSPFYFQIDASGLVLKTSENQTLKVDMRGNNRDYLRPLKGRGELLAKAFGLIQRDRSKIIFDFTGGLLVDALCLVRLGAQEVHVWERSPWLIPLLMQALKEAKLSEVLGQWMHQLILHPEDASHALYHQQKPHGIYLDPMFDEYNEKALPKEKFQVLRKLITESQGVEGLLDRALGLALERVVVKRPRKAPFLLKKPSYELTGKKIRYDVYIVPQKK